MRRAPAEPVDARAVAAAREALTGAAPLVQCITNSVVQTITANALLAAGAAPAMVDNPHEAAAFAAVASAVLVNVGTPTDDTARAMRLAAAAAAQHGTPWVLDPVAVGALGFRTRLAGELLEHRPAVVRGNASEVLALAGAGGGGREVDSTAAREDAAEAAGALGMSTGAAVAVPGDVDVVTDGTRTVRVSGGDPLLTRTTGAGCALGAVSAATTAAVVLPLLAAVAAHVHVGLAAEVAAEVCGGPGSFAIAWLDALDAVGPDAVRAGARLA
ncbi:hydroxyethylthiazole kinase [Kineococcus glutinatus]|uniref:Hydroxyethylthiazole kinase n=1 Tax=Kineococcus glutinatus TaxID=1070872 RepID=A0ABP9H8E8_9ACTN